MDLASIISSKSIYSSPKYGLFLDFNLFAGGLEESDLCLALFDSAFGVEAISEPLWVWIQESQTHRTDQVGRDHRVSSGPTSLLKEGHPREHCPGLHPDGP